MKLDFFRRLKNDERKVRTKMDWFRIFVTELVTLDSYVIKMIFRYTKKLRVSRSCVFSRSIYKYFYYYKLQIQNLNQTKIYSKCWILGFAFVYIDMWQSLCIWKILISKLWRIPMSQAHMVIKGSHTCFLKVLFLHIVKDGHYHQAIIFHI